MAVSEISDHILDDLGQRYKRNVVVISFIGIALAIWPEMLVTGGPNVFGLAPGKHLWMIGGLLLVYNLGLFIYHASLSFVQWWAGIKGSNYITEIGMLFGKPSSESHESRLLGDQTVRGYWRFVPQPKGGWISECLWKDEAGQPIKRQGALPAGAVHRLPFGWFETRRMQYRAFVWVDIVFPSTLALVAFFVTISG